MEVDGPEIFEHVGVGVVGGLTFHVEGMDFLWTIMVLILVQFLSNCVKSSESPLVMASQIEFFLDQFFLKFICFAHPDDSFDGYIISVGDQLIILE